MNVCGNGICVCDNYEYPATRCKDSMKPFLSMPAEKRYYYLDKVLDLPFATTTPVPGRTYFHDPELTMKIDEGDLP